MYAVSDLISVADTYLAATGSKEVTVSFWVFNDSKKLAALRGGADITVGRFNAAFEWFSDNWPDRAVWPAGAFRPQPQRSAALDDVHGAASQAADGAALLPGGPGRPAQQFQQEPAE